MKRSIRVMALAGLLIPLLLSACVLPSTDRYHLHTRFLRPIDGSVIPVAPITLTAVMSTRLVPGFFSSLHVSGMTFFANGVEIGNATTIEADDDASSPEPGIIYIGSRSWTPPAPGEYFIQVKATLTHLVDYVNGDYSSAIRLCVVDDSIAPPGSLTYHGYSGVCPLPTRDPSAPTTGTIDTVSATVNPSSLGFCPEPDPNTYPSLLFTVSIQDPADQIELIDVFIKDSDSRNAWGDGVALGLTSIGPSGEKIFTGTEDLAAEFYRPLSYIGSATFLGDLLWLPVARLHSGELLSESWHTIPVHRCVPLEAPFSFATPTPVSTATPASARDCPSGTFFAEQTHRCIPVQILPTKPGHSGGGCPQYGDPSSCTSNGCSWDKPSNTCH